MIRVTSEVSLVWFNRESEMEKMFLAAMQCHNEKTGRDLVETCAEDYEDEDKLKLVLSVLRQGHMSIAEHCVFQFAVGDVSRICSHQVVRNRVASYAQQSGRYVPVDSDRYRFIEPPSIRASRFHDPFISLVRVIAEFIEEMVDGGIPTEDARIIDPPAHATGIIWSLNLRELTEVCHERLCTRAQWEYRGVAAQMVHEVIKAMPWTKEFLVPKCEVVGFCKEKKGCGRMPKKEK